MNGDIIIGIGIGGLIVSIINIIVIKIHSQEKNTTAFKQDKFRSCTNLNAPDTLKSQKQDSLHKEKTQ